MSIILRRKSGVSAADEQRAPTEEFPLSEGKAEVPDVDSADDPVGQAYVEVASPTTSTGPVPGDADEGAKGGGGGAAAAGNNLVLG